jgi:hypothetical protein
MKLMKALCLAYVMWLGLPGFGLGQGLVLFRNAVLTSTLNAPIYGPEPGDPTVEKHGNTVSGLPAGNQAYGGALLAGTGYTAQLWAGALVQEPGYVPFLQPVASTGFRTFGSGLGIFATPNAGLLAIPGVLPGERAWFEVRVWDNQGGAITEWAQVLADPGILRGQSGIFSPPSPLGATADTAPALAGLESFNIHTVPEPGLGLLSAGAAFALWAMHRLGSRDAARSFKP